MAGKCSHEDSRLTCVDCGQPICSNCMVQCPVGARCKSCVAAVKNPFKDISPWVVVRSLFACIAVGLVGGWACVLIAIPYIACIICYFIGLFAGRWLAKVIDPKLAHNTARTVVFGVLIGMSLSPLGLLPFVMVQTLGTMFSTQGISIFGPLCCLAGAIFNPVCFVVGVLRPTIWGERWW